MNREDEKTVMNRGDGKTEKSVKRARASRDASGISGAGDDRLLFDRSLDSDLSSRAKKWRSLRSHLFAHHLAVKYLDALSSSVLDFLSEYFGAKFSSTKATRLAGEKFYRQSGGAARRSARQSRLHLALSLNFTPHPFASYPNLIRLSPARGTVSLHTEMLRRETHLAPATSPAQRSLPLLQHAARTARELKEILTLRESVTREISGQVRHEADRRRDVNEGLASRLTAVARNLPVSQARFSLTRHAQTLLIPQTRRTKLVPSTPQQGAPKPDSIRQVYLAPQSNVSILSKAIPHRTILSARREYPQKGLRPTRLERVFNTLRQEGRSRRAIHGKQVAAPGLMRLLHSNPSEFIRRSLAVPVLLNENRASAGDELTAPAHLRTARRHATPPQAHAAQRNGMTKASADAKYLIEQRESLQRVLVALRHETKLELQSVAQVFAPPQRHVNQTRSPVKQVEEKEVLETIKREVKTQIRSHSSVANFTRADFTVITDHIYDALARRLLTERERLGLNY